jgi:hypothetical protein
MVLPAGRPTSFIALLVRTSPETCTIPWEGLLDEMAVGGTPLGAPPLHLVRQPARHSHLLPAQNTLSYRWT